MKTYLVIVLLFFFTACEDSGSSNSEGSTSVMVESIGSSTSKFKIYNNRLYSIKDNFLKVYDISDADNIQPLSWTYLNSPITSMFVYDEKLIAATNSGLKIFSIKDDMIEFLKNSDTFIPCQRFFVEDTLLYVLNNLDTCKDYLYDMYSYDPYYYEEVDRFKEDPTNNMILDNGIEVYDVSDFSSPKLLTKISSYNPIALSVKDDLLYVCEGKYGLKVYDINRSENNISLSRNNIYRDAKCSDLITSSGYLYTITADNLGIYDYNQLDNILATLKK